MDRVAVLAFVCFAGIVAAPWVVAPAAGLALWALLWCPLARWRLMLLAPGLFALGLAIGQPPPPGPELDGVVALQGVVAAAPMGRRADVEVWACAIDGAPFLPCRGRVRVVFDEPPRPRSRWVVRGRASPPPGGALGGPDEASAMARAGVRSVVWAQRAVPLDGEPASAAPVRGGQGLLAAVARGDRRGVEPEAWQVLRDTGTAHLLAISGFHVGVVAAAVGGLFALVARRAAWLLPRGLPPALPWWVGAAAALAYAWGAGAPISAQRAAGMVLLAAVARSLGRGVAPWRWLPLVAVAVAWADPVAPYTPGFQLSFGAVLGLLRFGPPLQRALALPRPLGWLGAGLSATTAATLGTLPAAAWWFQSLSWTSPLANLLAIPWMTFGIAPLAAAWAYGPEPIATWAGALGARSVEAWLAALGLLAAAPLTPAVSAAGALSCAAIGARARPGWVLAVCLLALGLKPRPRGGLEVEFLDVGQGDATLVQFPDGRRWLVDGGRRRWGLAAALRRRGVRRLDRVVASHSDADHVGGLAEVLCALEVGGLRIGRERGHEGLLEAAAACGVPVRVEGKDDALRSNEASLVTFADSPWGGVLLTGDLPAEAEPAAARPAAVLKVPHHGSRTSSSPAFLGAVKPQVAVLPVGPNRYGHPHAEAMERYDAAGVPVLRTDRDGSVRVRLDPRGIRAYRATGPVIWFSRERRAPTRNTPSATTISTALIPWLYDSSGPNSSGRK